MLIINVFHEYKAEIVRNSNVQTAVPFVFTNTLQCLTFSIFFSRVSMMVVSWFLVGLTYSCQVFLRFLFLYFALMFPPTVADNGRKPCRITRMHKMFTNKS